MFLANVGSMFNHYDAKIFLYKPQRLKCFFISRLTKLGRGVMASPRMSGDAFRFRSRFWKNQGGISLIVHTHIPEGCRYAFYGFWNLTYLKCRPSATINFNAWYLVPFCFRSRSREPMGVFFHIAHTHPLGVYR